MTVTEPKTTAPIVGLPPGSRAPKLLQSLAGAYAHQETVDKLRRRYGPLMTVKSLGIGRLVLVNDPSLIRTVFTADPTALHAGEQSPLRPILGRNSLLGIDEERHLSQRKLLLPSFHGERMATYQPIIEEEALREISMWPQDSPMRTLEPMMRITLNVILRAVFGAEGADLDALRELMPQYVSLGSGLALLPMLHHDLGPLSPWGRFLRMRRRFDDLVGRLIDRARNDPQLEERSDVLSLLVLAKHEDGSPMSFEEIADQLGTLLAAGHETTAATLSWAIERLIRHPELLARLVEEADAGGKELREATIREVQRARPVIPFAGRFVVGDFELGGYLLPRATVIAVSMAQTHANPDVFDEPQRFDPDRFLRAKPETYAWVPFGGGIRRCIGAAFAQLEMDVVLRTLLTRTTLAPSTAADERLRFRGVAFAPAQGGVASFATRVHEPVPQASLAA